MSPVPSSEEPIVEFQFLDADQCQDLRERIHSVRSRWIKRHPEVPFFTIGAASYLDAGNGKEQSYREMAGRGNDVLDEHFSDLLDRFAEVMSEQLGAPAFYDRSIALPGFHVYLAHPVFAQGVASVHYDLQYEGITWDESYGDIDFDTQVSITVSVALPQEGGGLNHWDLDIREMRVLSPEDFKERVKASERHYHPYKTGGLAMHPGHLLHQGSLMKNVQLGDERITLQAHGLPTDKGWVLYW